MVGKEEQIAALRLLVDARRQEHERARELCDRLRRELMEAERDLTAKHAELGRYQQDLRKLTGEEAVSVADGDVDVRFMNRTDAVLHALGLAGPASPSGLAETLAQFGRGDQPRDISSSLAHLKRKGAVRKVQHGLWERTAPPDSPS